MSGPHLQGAVGWPGEFAERYRARGLWLGQSLPDWFAERVDRHAERIAVVDGDERITYRELGERVETLARGLAALGIAPLAPVVLQLPNGLDLLETFLALSVAGAIPVLALPAHRQIELSAFCQKTRAVALVTPQRQGAEDWLPIAAAVRAAAPELRHVIVQGNAPTDDGWRSLAEVRSTGRGSPIRRSPIAASEVALLQLSGGSTGMPKLIARTHDDYLYSVRASAELCRLTPASRFLAALPMTHNFTLSSPGMLGILDTGGAVVVCRHSSAAVVFDLLLREDITIVAAVPSLVRAWVHAKERHLGARTLPGLTLQVGGAKLDEQLARRVLRSFGCGLQQVFGMGEGLVNYTRLDDPEETIVTTQGRPLSAFDEIRIASPDDPEGPALEPGATGELQTRGPYTIRGYFNDASSDRRSFTADGYYRTGDLVRQTAAGDLVVEGRLGDRILRGAEKISPVEVESLLREHPAVADAAVVGVFDDYLGQKTCAFVTRADATAPLTMSELRTFLRRRGLAEFKLPDRLELLAQLPLTRLGKLDKAALRSAAAERVALRTPDDRA